MILLRPAHQIAGVRLFVLSAHGLVPFPVKRHHGIVEQVCEQLGEALLLRGRFIGAVRITDRAEQEGVVLHTHFDMRAFRRRAVFRDQKADILFAHLLDAPFGVVQNRR